MYMYVYADEFAHCIHHVVEHNYIKVHMRFSMCILRWWVARRIQQVVEHYTFDRYMMYMVQVLMDLCADHHVVEHNYIHT